jgi:hypothetical protein
VTGDRERGAELIGLVVRCLAAQAVMVVAIDVPFARGNVTAIAGAFLFVVLIIVVAALVRSGTSLSRMVALTFESGVLLYGLYDLVVSRAYQAGTIFALVIVAVLLHPAVARAFTDAVPEPSPTDRGAH